VAEAVPAVLETQPGCFKVGIITISKPFGNNT